MTPWRYVLITVLSVTFVGCASAPVSISGSSTVTDAMTDVQYVQVSEHCQSSQTLSASDCYDLLRWIVDGRCSFIDSIQLVDTEDSVTNNVKNGEPNPEIYFGELEAARERCPGPLPSD